MSLRLLLALTLTFGPIASLSAQAIEVVPVSEIGWSSEVGGQSIVGDCGCQEACESDYCCDACDPWCCRNVYASVFGGGSFMKGQSGGFNTSGPHPNTNSDTDDLFFFGGALGVASPQEFGRLRLEVEGRGRSSFSGITDSFPGPPTPTFFYDVDLRDGWSVMANAWFDVALDDCYAVYFGGGMGAAGYDLTVNDTVVEGSGNGSEFAWQAGLGLIYQVNDRVELDFGYRYTDLGTADIPLAVIGGGAPAGNYTLDVTTHDLLLQVRVYEPFAFLRR